MNQIVESNLCMENGHVAIREILSEIQVILDTNNSRIMARVGSNLAKKWIDGKTFSNLEDLLKSLEDCLKDELQLADRVECELMDDRIQITIEGCIPCCRNLVKAKGGKPACPISSFALTTINKAFPQIHKVMLESIEKIIDPSTKEPYVGICIQNIKIKN